ncbi:MAG TPA: glycosyltransferase family 2 protein, partial [Paracoccaceae bacterium]|nr:glycosyltransferase family 2 protein [Paracoccaceae bacterium]
MPDRPKDTGRRILFSAQKNEGPFLLEWIAYHKVVGFTDIIIFSNDCTDGSDDMLDALARAGEIQHFRHSPETGQSPQLRAAEIAMESGLFRFGDWVMWLDSDEYLVLNVGKGTIPDFLASIGEVD